MKVNINTLKGGAIASIFAVVMLALAGITVNAQHRESGRVLKNHQRQERAYYGKSRQLKRHQRSERRQLKAAHRVSHNNRYYNNNGYYNDGYYNRRTGRYNNNGYYNRRTRRYNNRGSYNRRLRHSRRSRTSRIIHRVFARH